MVCYFDFGFNSERVQILGTVSWSCQNCPQEDEITIDIYVEKQSYLTCIFKEMVEGDSLVAVPSSRRIVKFGAALVMQNSHFTA